MKLRKSSKYDSGFTLVELLTVIAIIGILAAILIPTVGSVMKRARITAAGSNARQICQAYNVYALSGPRMRTITNTAAFPNGASTVAEWAGVLAVYAGLNDASFWYVNDDPSLPATPATVILNAAGDAVAMSNAGLAYSVIVNTPRAASSSGSTTPIMWTRGWTSATNGWPATAPWGVDGGHVGFLDGHVTWQRTTDENNPGTGDYVTPSYGPGPGVQTADIETAAGIGSGVSPTPALLTPGS